MTPTARAAQKYSQAFYELCGYAPTIRIVGSWVEISTGTGTSPIRKQKADVLRMAAQLQYRTEQKRNLETSDISD